MAGFTIACDLTEGTAMKHLLIFLVLACISAFAYDHYQKRLSSAPPDLPPPARITAEIPKPSAADTWRPPPRPDTRTATAAQTPASRCDGRTHCSQMRSCDDAKTQMRCPNAAMDGDGDGIPCERQWCQ